MLGGGMLAGLGATMAQGFAFGTGSAMAHSAINSIFSGGSSSAPAPAPAAAPAPAPIPAAKSSGGPCEIDNTAFLQCLQQNQGNVQTCDFYYNALQSCQAANKY